ncbi:MAG: helicase, partial [Armatimonadetes bacterium]|nr:helicase [Candidatus Hippobium faecium]
NLKDKFKEIIPTATDMKYLVGYFYFSAVPELFEELKAKPDLKLKILVGLNSETYIKSSYENTKEAYIGEIAQNFNSDYVDCEDFYSQFGQFIEWVQNDRIIIRKTRDDNHSKLYLFKYGTPTEQNRFITGSSNLTRAGLYGQDEFNVEVLDNNDFNEAEEYFDRLWEEAVYLTEDDFIKEQIIKKLTEETQARQVTPFEAYVYILKTYLSLGIAEDKEGHLANTLKDAGFIDYKYQTDAVREALYKIDNYGGVILGDVVGLGKSIIASLVANQLPGRSLILCPPGLIGDVNTFGWEYYVEKFKIHARVQSSSSANLEKIDTENLFSDYENVIIDEAHRFRNAKSDTYGHLKNICRGKKVILLTATPFNNRPMDIHNLLALFLSTRKINMHSKESMFETFSKAEKQVDDISYILKNKDNKDTKVLDTVQKKINNVLKGESVRDIDRNVILKLNDKIKECGKDIKGGISDFIIRRNRIDITNNPDYKSETGDFAKVCDPREGLYELDTSVSDFYDDILEKYFGRGGAFTGAVYRPANYETKDNKIKSKDTREVAAQRQNQLYDFMKRIIVKRLESSFGAFKVSIDRFLEIHTNILNFVRTKKYYILNRKFMSDYSFEDEDSVLSVLAGIIDEKGKDYDKYEFTDKGLADFISDMEKDISLFSEIKKRFEDLKLAENDTKFLKLNEIINEIRADDPQRKILVFSEFADTVIHLKNKFAGINRKDVEYAYGNNINLKRIEKEFDASYNSNPKELVENPDTKNILISTDKMSEGHNLNRAGVVINYDIPWNPVRVIQRVGRINRISKKVFDELYIYNFFPSEKTATTIRVKGIATRKMLLIHNILGEDAKIFSPDEVPSESELYNKLKEIPDANEEESFYTYVRRLYKEIEDSTDPKVKEILEKTNNVPERIKTCKIYDQNEVLLFLLQHNIFIRYKNCDTDEEWTETKLNKDIIEKIRCTPDTPRETLSKKFWEHYPKLRDFEYKNDTLLGSAGEETKAYNTLGEIQEIINSENYHPCSGYKEFIRMLIKDIKEMGALTYSDYKKITKWKINDKLEKQISDLY